MSHWYEPHAWASTPEEAAATAAVLADVGYRFRQVRRERGYSVRCIADALCIPKRAVRAFERGHIDVRLSFLRHYAAALGVQIIYDIHPIDADSDEGEQQP